MSLTMQLKDFSGHGAGSSSFTKIRSQANLAIELNSLLWEAYNTLDHGDHDERLATLKKLEEHFDKVSPYPASKR